MRSGKGRRDAEKEKYWRSQLQEADASGKSVRAFCRERDLKENLFYCWRRELKRRDRQDKAGFVELISGRPGVGSAGLRIEIGERVGIVVERGFDAESLRAVFNILSEA